MPKAARPTRSLLEPASVQCLKIPYLSVRVRVRPFWRSGRVPGSGFTRFWIPAQPPKNPNPEIYPDEIFFKDFSVFRGGIA